MSAPTYNASLSIYVGDDETEVADTIERLAAVLRSFILDGKAGHLSVWRDDDEDDDITGDIDPDALAIKGPNPGGIQA